MNKQKQLKLYLDFDNTIANTMKSMVCFLNDKFNTKQDYIKLTRYNFTNLFPKIRHKDLMEYFESQEIFNNLEYMPGFLDCIDTVLDYCVTIVTSGTTKNLELKTKWLHKDFSFPIIQIDTDKKKCTDKSEVDMSDGIFIDDNIECLRSSNAKIKILIKNDMETDWNKTNNDEVYIVNTWKEIKDILDFYLKVGMIV